MKIKKLTADHLLLYGHPERFAKNYLDLDTKIVTKEDVIAMSTNRQAIDTDTWIMVGFMYRVTHFNHDNVIDTSNPYQQVKKRAKRNYDRIFSFGDLQGGTFAIISAATEQSKKIMQYKNQECVIGAPFAIINPKYSQSNIRKDMSVFMTGKPLIPLKQNITNILPTVTPKDPQGGETTFFFVENKILQVQQPELCGKGDIQPASCAGTFCDRMHRFKTKNEACGCFHRPNGGNLSAVVLEVDINTNPPELMLDVTEHRSLRTTQLFIKNIEMINTASREEHDDIRKPVIRAVRNCVNHINNRGGFTLIGTVSRGMSQDQSNNKGEKVESNKANTALCYVYPTNEHIINSDAYQWTMLDPRNIPPIPINLVDDNNDPANGTATNEAQNQNQNNTEPPSADEAQNQNQTNTETPPPLQINA